MGLKVLPEHILKRMNPADRAPLGKAGVTCAEANAKHDQRRETLLQKDMANLLAQRELFHLRSRMDKRTTLPKGMPDFFIVLPGGRILAVEAKVEGGDLSDDQRRVFGQYWSQTKNVVHIVWNLEQFRELLDEQAA